jgi:hypothetical protein
MNHRRTLCIALFPLLSIMACAIPGIPSSSTSVPVPVVDNDRLQTMVAGTVAAAIAKTEQAAPTAETPSENVPTPSKTPASTDEITAPGSSLTAQDDGTILFVDEHAKFQVNISPGWLPVRINEQEYLDAFSLPAAADAAVQSELTDIKTLDPNIFRLFVYDLQDGHLISGVITGIDFVWDVEGVISLENDAGIQEAADDLAASTPGLNVTSSSVTSTANEIPIGIILCELAGETFSGADAMLFQKHVHLNLPSGVLIISFTTEQNFKDATLPFFDTMIETIKINP